MSVLMLPKAFSNGGWGVSAIFLATSGLVSLITARKLIDAGLATNLYNYPLIVEKILGKGARYAVEAAIGLT